MSPNTAQTPYLTELEWNATPPPHVQFLTHKFSIIDSFENASHHLRLDPGIQAEEIVVGRGVSSVIVSLPQFVEATPDAKTQLLPKRGPLTILGKIGRRTILLDMDKNFDFSVVVRGCLTSGFRSNAHEVLIRMVESKLPPSQGM